MAEEYKTYVATFPEGPMGFGVETPDEGDPAVFNGEVWK